MNSYRKKAAWDKRNEANIMANERPLQKHYSNGDELKYRHKSSTKCTEKHLKEESDFIEKYKKNLKRITLKLDGKPAYPVSFTKGLPHCFHTGLLKNPLHFTRFVKGIDSGDARDFRETPLGPDEVIGCQYYNGTPENSWKSWVAQYGIHTIEKPVGNTKKNPVGLRAWESQSAGLAFDLEGPDAQAVTMPPAPEVGSSELTAEMAEVYVQALLRDTPFNAMSAGNLDKKFLKDKSQKITDQGVANSPILEKLVGKENVKSEDVKKNIQFVLEHTEELKKLDWFKEKDLHLSDQEKIRQKDRLHPTPSNAFRGITTGDEIGPYISQFLLIGNKGVNGNDSSRDVADGLISYGAITIDQRVRNASPINYMTKWEEWFDVQNAANVGGLEKFENGKGKTQRFIYTPRDLATYVHYDALYEAYLNACLILLSKGTPFDPGIPFQENDNRDHQQGFAHFGGPHLLSLVTEVATRALKAVRFQKYNIHRRCRPEVLAARITKANMLKDISHDFAEMRGEMGVGSGSILHRVNSKNGMLYQEKTNKGNVAEKNYLLPMAFCEGSPMHPAYGAGHATVAGACVTILKAFFDCQTPFKPNGEDSSKAFVSIDQGKRLELVHVFDQLGNPAHLTVEGELNKLASNISIGRNWAGVHYFTDYYESLLMGEEIAIGILEEQKLMFQENFSMSIPLFGGGTYRI